MMILPLKNAVQPYAWGSATAIPELFGTQNPSGKPMAEIWMGAHPKAPSKLGVDGAEVALDSYIRSDPEGTLGLVTASRFDSTLPFLFKILSAAEPLSIQAHPSKAQAVEGFRRENAAGIDLGAPERNYRDDNHKPELIYALTDFWGLRGFRPPQEIREAFSRLPGHAASEITMPRDDESIADFFRSLMTLPPSARRATIESAAAVAAEAWPDASRMPVPGEPDAPSFWLRRLVRTHPGDVGALAPLFLHVFSLRPGEATFQPAGVLHAYLHGTGAELMANSDNVLRGGLSVKHVDLDELLAVGVFRAETPEVITGAPRPGGPATCATTDFAAPFEEFAFSRVDVDGDCEFGTDGPTILFCSSGRVSFGSGAQECELRPGESVFVRADEPALKVGGSGVILQAAVGMVVPR